MGPNKEGIAREVAFQVARSLPGERIRVSYQAESGGVRGVLGWAALFSWVVELYDLVTERHYTIALTDGHVLLLRTTRLSQRVRRVRRAVPRAEFAARVRDVRWTALAEAEFRVRFPGWWRSRKLRVEPLWKDEFAHFLAALSLPPQQFPPQGYGRPGPGQRG